MMWLERCGRFVWEIWERVVDEKNMSLVSFEGDVENAIWEHCWTLYAVGRRQNVYDTSA